ncbi:MAG: HAD family hydrolase, partial [Candidatus Methylacidiphilales bacterium]
REALREQVVCLTCIGTAEALEDLAGTIQAKYSSEVEIHLFENLYSPGWFWLTVHDKKASKDQAIRILMETRGLSDFDLVVFGDQTNDLKMFQIATTAVAVANAVPTVLEKAGKVIGTNEQDSVVKFVKAHWSQRPAPRQTPAI